jgi:hypothetical protein
LSKISPIYGVPYNSKYALSLSEFGFIGFKRLTGFM